MKKKIFIQLFLFSLFLFLSIFSYYTYFNKESQNVIEVTQDKDLNKKNSETNLITDLKYFSVDEKGNKYEITSKYGEISPDNPDIIMMENVKAIIKIYNSDPIIITSNFAKYNIKNYDTSFEENILVKPIDYYYSNSIARSSKVMSECKQISKKFLFTGIEKAS